VGTTDSAELTERLVEITQPPLQGQRFLRDSVQPGLALRITATGTKSFVVEGWVNGRSRRTTLGKTSGLTVQQARKLTKQTLGQWAAGVDTVELARERQRAEAARKALEQSRGVTLGQVFERYLAGRRLSPKTLYDYRRILERDLSDWRDKPVVGITRDLVEQRHRAITERSPSLANLVSRLLRALLNYAAETLEDGAGHALITDNPTRRLRAVKAWNPCVRRETYIKPGAMENWFRAVAGLENITHRDYLLFTLLMGCRRSESAQLRWEDVDFDTGAVCFRDTKNGDDAVLPLSDYAAELLRTRLPLRATSDYVFPGEHGRALVDCRKSLAKVIAQARVPFTLHDLRRTYATTAESVDLGAYSIKLLLNHRSGRRHDVTGGYIARDLQRLRSAQQRITEALLRQAGIAATGTSAQATPPGSPLPSRTG